MKYRVDYTGFSKSAMKENQVLEKLYLKNIPLFEACKDGDLDRVKLLLSIGGIINVWDKEGITPLMVASQKGHLEIVKYLIYNNANVKIYDYYGRTALNHAGENFHLEIVKFIIEKYNIDVTEIDKITYNENHLVDEYYKKNIRNEYGDLLLLRWKANLPLLKYLVSKGIDIHYTYGEFSLLIDACNSNNLERVTYLVELGADVNFHNEYFETPLICACYIQNINIVKYLIDCGANVFYEDKNGNTLFNNEHIDKGIVRQLENYVKAIHRKDVISKLLK